jgi:periplasmic divalent cation tolerance protein
MKWARMNNVSIAFFDLLWNFSMTDKIVVLSTCASEEEAEALARSMVEQRLAACVNVIPRMRSYYRWKGALESTEEWLLLIKTSRDRFHALMAALEKAHSYEIPEVLALQVVDGAANYLNWIDVNLRDQE